MQFKIPQDVQLEDRIIGPLTMKQLGICAAGGSVSYFFYITLAKNYYWEIWLIPVALSALLTIAVAFIKLYNVTFTKFILLLAEYNLKVKKRYWIKGSGLIYPSILRIATKEEKKLERKITEKVEKTQNNLEEIQKLSKLLDSK